MSMDVLIISSEIPSWLKPALEDIKKAGGKVKRIARLLEPDSDENPEREEVLIDLFSKPSQAPKLVLVDLFLSVKDKDKISQISADSMESLKTIVMVDSYMPPFASVPVLGVFAEDIPPELQDYLEEWLVNIILIPDGPELAAGKFAQYLRKQMIKKRQAMALCAKASEANIKEVQDDFANLLKNGGL